MNSSTRQFKDRGVITRIELENFVTYSKVVVTPGRGLNVIIGPNGTGKSTIVMAILLGLGGKPGQLGKKVILSEFIRAGTNKAKIEITLRDTDKKNIVLGRAFDSANHSIWSKNGKTISATEFDKIVDDFNIQVGNLCQFLPQDKVQDFSKMGPTELLINTEKSVGDGSLFNRHEQLIESRKDQLNIQKQIETKKGLLVNETQKFQGLQQVVGGIKEKKAMKNKVLALNQKLMWARYDHCRQSGVDAKEKVKEAQKVKKELEKKLAPINENIETLSMEIEKMKRTVDEHRKKILLSNKRFRQLLDDISVIRQSITQAEQECKRALEEEKNRDKEIALANQQKSKWENDLQLAIEQIGTEESISQQIPIVGKKLEQQRHIVNSSLAALEECRSENHDNSRRINALQAQRQSVQNVESKKLEILRSRNPHAYQGTMWLRQNRGLFKGIVHEPIMLNIQPKQEKYAKFFETLIAQRDLFAFVCERADDMNLLLRNLREQQKLVVNVVHSNPLKRIRTAPDIPIEELRPYGFEDYLINLIDGPETILKYLIPMNHLHKIPVGSALVNNNVDRIPSVLFRYCSPTHLYTISTSMYSGQKSSHVSRISNRAELLSVIVDTGKLTEIDNSLRELYRRQEEIGPSMEKLQETAAADQLKLDSLRAAKQKISRDLKQVHTLKDRLNVESAKVRDLEDGRRSPEVIQEETKQQIQAYINRQLKYFDQINSLFDGSVKLASESEQFSFRVKLKDRILAARKNENQDLRIKYAEASDDVREWEKQSKLLLEKSNNCFEEACKTTDGHSPKDKQKFKKYLDAFAKLPARIEDMTLALQEAKAKVHCLGNHQDGERILQDYEATERNINNTTADIARLTTDLEVNLQETQAIFTEWWGPLEALIGRINQNFSKNFADMNCAGEVSLEKGENELNYQDYGLKIRVKFRNADELHEFTRDRQSGGERAVTTGIYMISLQELSRVPFRCVDELNQGMDSTNEKMVFQLITRITGMQDSSQYFLLTPKLLPNLEYGKHVTVHCVNNGPFVISRDEFNITDYCERLSTEHRSQGS